MKEFDFKPFDKVLVRTGDSYEWEVDLYGYFNENEKYHACVGGYTQQCIPYNDDTKHLLGTANPYKEPYEPKDGDFVTYVFNHRMNDKNIYIAINKNSYGNYYVSYQIKGCKNPVPRYDLKFINDYSERRPSTEEEKQILLSSLHYDGKDWDADKKEVVNWKWKPKKGEDYWALDFSCDGFEATDNTWDNDEVDNGFLEKGLVFKTREEAAVKAKELNEKLFGKENKL